jgi:tetratricopeptide (TPR) repeat protein
MKLQPLKNRRYKPLAAAVAATLLVVSVAHADPESGKLTLAGFVDAAAGTALLAGDYAAVIDKLAPHSIAFDADEVAASTNLCVAYVAMGRLDEAHDACDEAIKIARMDQRGATLQEHLAYENAVAVAYANRAVLTKLSGE